MRVLVLGSSGMAGHMICLVLESLGYDVTGFARKDNGLIKTVTGDALQTEHLDKVISDGKYDAVINCIGILNSDAEHQKDIAVFLNSYLPHHLCSVCENLNTRVVHLSTDCVFSGKTGSYTETDFPDGGTFYDRTKALGEIIDRRNLTLRTSIIGPDIDPNGIGLFNWFMKQSGTIKGYTGSLWNGITTLELAKVIDTCLNQGITGIVQPTAAEVVSKFKLLDLIKDEFQINDISIEPVEGIVQDKSLIRSEVEELGPSKGYCSMLGELREFMRGNSKMYPHYRSLRRNI